MRHRPADPILRSVIRSFAERRAELGQTVVTAPLPARPDQFIEFYLKDPYGVSHDDGPANAAPQVVIVGPQSYRRTRLVMGGDIHVFTIRFQPGGFHALFGVPMTQLADQGIPADDVIGAAAHGLRDAVLLAEDFDARVAAAGGWALRAMASAKPVDIVGRLAAVLGRSGGRLRIDALARRADLSDGQFTRRFQMQIGLAPKLFARTVRFNAVLSARANGGGSSWTELIHRAGYADQAHFIRDCHALAGAAPNAFFPEWAKGR